MAAVLACGPHAVVSHRTAAALLGPRPTERTNIDVTVPGRSRTTLDQAEVMQVFDLKALDDQLARNPHHPGARLLRAVLEDHYVGSTPTESELEEAFLALVRRLRLPAPKVNRWTRCVISGRCEPAGARSGRPGARSCGGRGSSSRRCWSWWGRRFHFGLGPQHLRRRTRLLRGTHRRLQPPHAHDPLAPSQGLGHAVGDAPAYAGHLPGKSTRLADERGYPYPLQSAWDDPAEGLEVVLDVEREPMGGDSARDVHADRRDLPVLDPNAGEIRPVLGTGPGRNALLAQGGDQRLLERAHVGDHVVNPDDRVADELPGTVVGDLATAIGLDDVDPLQAVPLLAHRELARGRAPPARVHGPVLEEQHHVGNVILLARPPDTLLKGERMPVLDGAELAHPELGDGGPHTADP